MMPFTAYTAAVNPNAFQWAGQPQKLPILVEGSGSSSNTWFIGPIRAYRPNGISIGSAVYAGLMNTTDRRTYRQTTLFCL